LTSVVGKIQIGESASRTDNDDHENAYKECHHAGNLRPATRVIVLSYPVDRVIPVRRLSAPKLALMRASEVAVCVPRANRQSLARLHDGEVEAKVTEIARRILARQVHIAFGAFALIFEEVQITREVQP
jgi:hypothetical protein